MKVLFLHGLESGPHGNKYQVLTLSGYDVIAPDFTDCPLAARVRATVPLLVAYRPLVVGSSYGGLTAVLAAMRAKVELPGMILCAPALERDEEPNRPGELNVACPTTIIHGTRDQIIPIEGTRRFIARNPHVQLVEVDDGHRLANSLGTLLKVIEGYSKSS